MKPQDPLLGAMVRREAGSHVWLSLAALGLMGILAAWTAASGHAASAGGAVRWLVQFDTTLPILLSVTGGLRLLQRPAEDRAGGWLFGYCGNTGRRAAYAFALWAGAVVVAVAALLWGVLAFTAGTLLFGLAPDPLTTIGARLLMGVLLIGSVSSYGLLIGIVSRDFGIALLIATVAVALPLAISVPYVLAHDALLPDLPRKLMVAHLPPMSLPPGPRGVFHHLLYMTALSLVLWRIAPSTVARL